MVNFFLAKGSSYIEGYKSPDLCGNPNSMNEKEKMEQSFKKKLSRMELTFLLRNVLLENGSQRRWCKSNLKKSLITFFSNMS